MENGCIGRDSGAKVATGSVGRLVHRQWYAGTVVKPADQEQTPEWLLSEFNFDLQGTTVLQ